MVRLRSGNEAVFVTTNSVLLAGKGGRLLKPSPAARGSVNAAVIPALSPRIADGEKLSGTVEVSSGDRESRVSNRSVVTVSSRGAAVCESNRARRVIGAGQSPIRYRR